MTDIVERLRTFNSWEKLIQCHRLAKDAADEIERLRDTSAEIYIKLAERADEIERLRTALMDIAGVSFVVAEDAPRMRSIAKKALGDE